MSSVPSPQDIAADATWLAQALDVHAGLARFIRMNREAYRTVSFLDDRMLQQPVVAHVLPIAGIAKTLASSGRTDARWIFHIGHVGSTLVARLLGELPGVLSVREPRSLRDLALCPAGKRAELAPTFQALMSRSFAVDQFAVVKATSFVSEIAAELVPPGERALFLFARPRAYIEGILAGENSVKELHVLAEQRDQRMSHRVGPLAEARRSNAHLAASAWACEMSSLEQAAEAMHNQRILWQDFDRMLGGMAEALREAARFFKIATTETELAAVAGGPLMRRYSKALEYEYSPALRAELLADARQRNRAEIYDAMQMLAEEAKRSPLLKRALDRAGTES